MKEPKECAYCGATFVPTHGKQAMCPDCREEIVFARGRQVPERRVKEYKTIDDYYDSVRINAIERVQRNDHMVAEGYAERQMADTLVKAGKIKTEL